jgi:O-antigen/teichoic acid export membrane protein
MYNKVRPLSEIAYHSRPFSTILQYTGTLGVSFVTLVFNAFELIIISRFLGAEGRGFLSAITVLPSLASQIVEWGQLKTITRAVGNSIFPERAVLRYIVFFSVAGGSLGAAACLFLMSLILRNSSYKLTTEFAASLVIPCYIGFQMIRGYLLGKNNIFHYNLITLFNIVVLTTGTLLSVFIFASPEAVLWSRVVSSTITVVLGLYIGNRLIEYKTFQYSSISPKYVLSNGALYTFGMIAIAALFRLDVLVVSAFSSTQEVGIYANGLVVPEVLKSLASALGVIIMARSANMAGDRRNFLKSPDARLMSWIVPTLAVTGSLAVYVMSDLLVTVAFGQSFLESAAITRIVLPGTALISCALVVQLYYDGLGRPFVTISCFGLSAIFECIADLIVVPRYGIVGAAYVCSLSYLLCSLVIIVLFIIEHRVWSQRAPRPVH